SGTPVSLPTCSVYSGGSLVGSFIVANVSIGSYTITATGTQAGDHASTSFTVSGGMPTITLNPTSGSAGSTVQVSGSGFSLSDTVCSLTGGGALASEACSVSGGAITASFIVANAASGSYLIQVAGNPVGDFAQAVFVIPTTIRVTLTPSAASPSSGFRITISGTGFSPTDSTCSISSPVAVNVDCLIQSGTIVDVAPDDPSAFTVGDVPPGQYLLKVSGNPVGDSAQVVFNVLPTVTTVTTASTSNTGTTVMTTVTSTVTQTVRFPAATSLRLSVSVSSTQVMFTVHLTGTYLGLTGSVPGESIVISTSWGKSGSCVTGSNGSCQVTFIKPASGAYSATAQFVGDLLFAGSTAKISLKT